MALVVVNIVLYKIAASKFYSVGSNPNTYKEFQTALNFVSWTSNTFKPKFLHQNWISNSFKPLQKSQIWNQIMMCWKVWSSAFLVEFETVNRFGFERVWSSNMSNSKQFEVRNNHHYFQVVPYILIRFLKVSKYI